jgi:hypothetical protein
MIHWDCFFDWLNKWQTLIAGILALTAAIWALRPVYKQLALAPAQNDAVLREKVGEIILQLDANAAEVFSIMSKRMVDLNNNLGWYEVHEKDYKFDEWCGEQQQEFIHAGIELKATFARSHDVEVVETRKADLLATVEALNGILWEVQRLSISAVSRTNVHGRTKSDRLLMLAPARPLGRSRTMPRRPLLRSGISMRHSQSSGAAW